MNKYQQKYYETQIDSTKKCEELAREIIVKLDSLLNTNMALINQIDNTNKLFGLLLNSQYHDILLPILEKYEYSKHAEFQFLVVNACLRYISKVQELPILQGYIERENGFLLQTQLGNISVKKAGTVIPEISSFTKYGQCHEQCESFIRLYNNVRATTALIDQPLGGYKHYHSFIEFENCVIDLSHNAYMTMVDYERCFAPIRLNSINGYELSEEERRINSQENLGEDKSLLLRLALDKQVRKLITKICMIIIKNIQTIYENRKDIF